MSGQTELPVDAAGVWMNAYADAHLQLATFKKAAGKLAAMARTSGGVAGRDDGLCGACDEVERLIAEAKPLPSPSNSHAELVRALEEIVSPIATLKKRAEADGRVLSEMAHSICNSASYLQDIARAALAKLPPAKGEM